MDEEEVILYQTKEGPLSQKEYKNLLSDIYRKKDYLNKEKLLNLRNSKGRLETNLLTKKQVTQLLELINFNLLGIRR
jgi:hypothetical protein